MRKIGEPDEWHSVFLWIPRKVGGRWRWLATVEQRLTPYPNPFAFIGLDFHKEYR